MPDREKVIKGLESCKHPFCQIYDCPYAPWDRDLTCKDELFDDALELLKELQRNPVIVCPHCGKRVD